MYWKLVASLLSEERIEVVVPVRFNETELHDSPRRDDHADTRAGAAGASAAATAEVRAATPASEARVASSATDADRRSSARWAGMSGMAGIGGIGGISGMAGIGGITGNGVTAGDATAIELNMSLLSPNE